jgi:hypothetical protein
MTPESKIESNVKDQFDNSFIISLPPAQAWPVLSDIRRVASCIPGVQLNEVESDGTYLGRLSVQLGGVPLSFACMVKFNELDPIKYEARLRAHGLSNSGNGRADADISFRLTPSDGGSIVGVHTDLVLSGAAAKYGHSVPLVQSTAALIMTQFASNLGAHFAAEGTRVAQAAV